MATEKTAEPKTTKTTKKAATKKSTTNKKASAAKKTPAPKTTKKPEFGAKTAFIKSQPTSMTAKQVVEAAAAKGITLSENLVYAARAASKAKKGGGASKRAKKATSKNKPGPKPKKTSGSTGGSLEATLRNAIAELGLARARAIFAEVERAFGG